MKQIFGKIVKYLFYGMFSILFLYVFSQLFLMDKINEVRESFGQTEVEVSQVEEFRIIYPEEAWDISPLRMDPVTRQRLLNIYEPLVGTSRDFTLKPALALSWGMIDDFNWEFKLRPNVYFHDESVFDVEDVLFSFDLAQNDEDSELSGFLDTIESVEKIDDLSFRIKTFEPDPLLLQRISMVLMIPAEYEEEADPVGTASYKLASWDKGEKMILVTNQEYWGERAQFKKVEIQVISDKDERVEALLEGEADFLAFVPYDSLEYVQENGAQVEMIPSLEVQFLLFNNESELFDTAEKREGVSLAIDQAALVSSIGGAAVEVNQYVSTGIFGFDQKIPAHEYNTRKAVKKIRDAEIEDEVLNFHLSEGLDFLGDFVEEQLLKVGLNVQTSYLGALEFMESLQNGSADLYFLAFKSDLADSGNFFDVIAHSDGEYNFANYKNEYLDKLIEDNRVEMDFFRRQSSLQNVMEILVQQDFIGLPLFEYETVYAFSDKFEFNPRLDGFIYFNDLIIK
jgi:peptide/nickel transport system substrate-binding protein